MDTNSMTVELHSDLLESRIRCNEKQTYIALKLGTWPTEVTIFTSEQGLKSLVVVIEDFLNRKREGITV